MSERQIAPDPQTLVGVLNSLGGGQVMEEATAALAGLVQQMQQIAEHSGGKPKGKLTITVDLKLDRGIFEADASVKVTAPQMIRNRTLLYGTPQGALVKNDPRQFGLALDSGKDVSTGIVRDFRTAAANDRS